VTRFAAYHFAMKNVAASSSSATIANPFTRSILQVHQHVWNDCSWAAVVGAPAGPPHAA
jgi:hypothetical protein